MGKILIIEDNPSNAEMMIRILEAAGHEVHHYIEGLKGAVAAREIRPDIILMDFDLPDINGRNLILVLHKQLPNTAIIAVTAHVDANSEKMAKRFGSVDYIAKPFEPNRLLEAVDAQLNKNKFPEQNKPNS